MCLGACGEDLLRPKSKWSHASLVDSEVIKFVTWVWFESRLSWAESEPRRGGRKTLDCRYVLCVSKPRLYASGENLKAAGFISGKICHEDLETFPVAAVIFKELCSGVRSAALKCCLWPVFKVELIVVHRRAGQGQCKATHNKHIADSFTCYTSQGSCSTQVAGPCWRRGRIFLLVRTHKTETQTRTTHSPNQTHIRHLLEKPRAPLPTPTPTLTPRPSFPFRCSLCITSSSSICHPCRSSAPLPPLATRAGDGCHDVSAGEMKGVKSDTPRPNVAMGLTPGYLKEEISHWHGVKDPDQLRPPKNASGMISCSRAAANKRSVCVWKDSVD